MKLSLTYEKQKRDELKGLCLINQLEQTWEIYFSFYEDGRLNTSTFSVKGGQMPEETYKKVQFALFGIASYHFGTHEIELF